MSLHSLDSIVAQSTGEGTDNQLKVSRQWESEKSSHERQFLLDALASPDWIDDSASKRAKVHSNKNSQLSTLLWSSAKNEITTINWLIFSREWFAANGTITQNGAI